MIKNNTTAAAPGHIVFKERKSGCIFYNQRIYTRLESSKLRRPIKYARGYNEALHLTINLTNKRNILKLNFQYKDGGWAEL